jgi:phenylpyruvate tautomerase PptA (4-oxalocrotonate tautomerase family)
MTINTSYSQIASDSLETGSAMPLFTVTMRSGRTVTEKNAISAAIHEASVSAGYPQDDHFQRFITLQEADLRISPLYPDLPKPRSKDVMMVEVLVSSGTEQDRKRSLLSEIVTRLQAAGTDPNDVMVIFGEIDRASSSFGGGRPALPVEVRP